MGSPIEPAVVVKPLPNRPRTDTASGPPIATAAELDALRADLVFPLAGIDPASMTDTFEESRGGGTRSHDALDVHAPRGTPVLSATDGRVMRLYSSENGGLMVYATDRSERFILMYGHLDAYAAGLQDDAPLKKGQVIGYVGSTGNARADAPHLHFAIARTHDPRRWSSGTPVNPYPLLRR